MTVKEVAKMLRVSDWTIYELVKTNQIPHFKCGRSVRFVKDEIEHWIKKAPK